MNRTFAPEGVDDPYLYNPYSNPTSCGLRLLAEIETAYSYEFCTTLAFQDVATNEVYLAQDAGCSCPVPFEEFKGTGDFTRYSDDDQVRRLVDLHHNNASSADVHAFLLKIKEATR